MLVRWTNIYLSKEEDNYYLCGFLYGRGWRRLLTLRLSVLLFLSLLLGISLFELV